jgi:hypothetical protein
LFILNIFFQGVSDAPEAFDLLKEFEALKESLDEEVQQRTKLEQGHSR